MADVELVIKIPREDYKAIKNKSVVGDLTIPNVFDAIRKGTPLPKRCDIQRIVPKRVDVQKWIYTECPNPNCNHELSTHHGDGYYSIEDEPSFCPKCGQALLWESEE